MPELTRRSLSGDQDFDSLVESACDVPLSGWDFSFLAGRTTSEPLPWSYVNLAAAAAHRAARVLDIDTGGGEVLVTIGPPVGSIAVEPYPPNVAVAKATLQPLGVEVRPRTTTQLPVPDAAFDLVLNRHGALHPAEVVQVLRPGGVFLTQQVGAYNDTEFNETFGWEAVDFGVVGAVNQAEKTLAEAGLRVTRIAEAWPRTRYLDIGAVVLQLRAVPWQVPGFDVERDRARLQAIHHVIVEEGSFTVTNHRLLLEATLPWASPTTAGPA